MVDPRPRHRNAKTISRRNKTWRKMAFIYKLKMKIATVLCHRWGCPASPSTWTRRARVSITNADHIRDKQRIKPPGKKKYTKTAWHFAWNICALFRRALACVRIRTRKPFQVNFVNRCELWLTAGCAAEYGENKIYRRSALWQWQSVSVNVRRLSLPHTNTNTYRVCNAQILPSS